MHVTTLPGQRTEVMGASWAGSRNKGWNALWEGMPAIWLGVASGFLRCLDCSLLCRSASSQLSFCFAPPFFAPAQALATSRPPTS